MTLHADDSLPPLTVTPEQTTAFNGRLNSLSHASAPLAAVADMLSPPSESHSAHSGDLFTATVLADLAALASGTDSLFDVARTGPKPARRLLAVAALRYRQRPLPTPEAPAAVNPSIDDQLDTLPGTTVLEARYRSWARQMISGRRRRKRALAQVAANLAVAAPATKSIRDLAAALAR